MNVVRLCIACGVLALLFPVVSVADVQHDALMDLYTATNGLQWTDNTDWGSATTPYCSWFGVTCSGTAVWKLYVIVIIGFSLLTGICTPTN